VNGKPNLNYSGKVKGQSGWNRALSLIAQCLFFLGVIAATDMEIFFFCSYPEQLHSLTKPKKPSPTQRRGLDIYGIVFKDLIN